MRASFTRRRKRVEIAALAIALFVAGWGSGSRTTSTAAKDDGFGDPFVTERQARSVYVGELASAAFHALGGKADSGSNGAQAPLTRSYDYPIRGTGNAEAAEENDGHET
jgi:hypothetical protein